MAIKAFNSVGGFTVGELANNVILANGDITTTTGNFTGNLASYGILTDNYYYANGAPVDFQQPAGSNTQVQYNLDNDFGASGNFTFDPDTNLLTVLGNIASYNANLGNTVVANFFTGTLTASSSAQPNITSVGNLVSLAVDGNSWVGGNLEVVGNIQGNVNISANGNISASNANLGNLATANYVNVTSNTITNNLTVNLDLSGNTANFTGNVAALNANLGNLAQANYVNVANDINVLGNVYAPNFVGALANGTSTVKVYQDANVEISINGSANLMSFTTTGLYVDGEINSTEGNIQSNGNVTANGFINAANANVTGEALLNSVRTGNIIGDGDGITITADGSNTSIALVPNGTGTVTTNGFRITVLGAPVDPQDAATKEYVDTIGGTGLIIHDPVKVETHIALNATYTQGGTTQTTTTITSNSIITFSANHGLSIGDGIVWDNSFNGIVGGESYWVHSVESLTSITIKPTYYGEIITTLTNGAGLSQTSRANPGVGATLTNAGANAAIAIDGITLSLSDRVLVHGQVNSAYDGIYVVTVVGDGATAWELTRSSDMNMYIPKSASGMCAGSYLFVQQGLTGAGESYVLTQPITEIIIGTDNLTFSLFSAAGAYTAGNGIAITGTIISANVDNISTEIYNGNIVVKSGANLVSPNLGNATFSSMTWDTVGNGNVSANNLSIDNVANITLDLTVGGLVQVNGNISSNANVNSNNSFVGNILDVGGNITGNNISANYMLSSTDANISNLATAGNITVTYELSGNTANFSGNVTVSNLQVNLELAGNTANFTGNIVTLNANLGNLAQANYIDVVGNAVTNNATVNLELSGNTANFTGNVDIQEWLYVANTANVGNLRTDNLLYANGQPWDMQQAAGSNTQIQYNSSNDFGASANLTFNSDTNVLGVIGVANISNAILVGNSTIGWGTITTSSIGANQTIAAFDLTGTTVVGLDFLVKGVDASGSKYSVATVQAVTDGSTVDYVVYATGKLGLTTGTLAVNVAGGVVSLQVTPASSNSTVWTTQYRAV